MPYTALQSRLVALCDLRMQLQHYLTQYSSTTAIIADDLCAKKNELHLGFRQTTLLTRLDYETRRQTRLRRTQLQLPPDQYCQCHLSTGRDPDRLEGCLVRDTSALALSRDFLGRSHATCWGALTRLVGVLIGCYLVNPGSRESAGALIPQTKQTSDKDPGRPDCRQDLTECSYSPRRHPLPLWVTPCQSGSPHDITRLPCNTVAVNHRGGTIET